MIGNIFKGSAAMLVAVIGVGIAMNGGRLNHTLHTEILIKATPAQVWTALLDERADMQWNPFIKSVRGELTAGAQLSVLFADGMTFTPDVVRYSENEELVWQGKLGVSGVFDGRHRFKVKDAGQGTTLFEQSENFGGILFPALWMFIADQTEEGFGAMNSALKQRVEHRKD